MLDLRDYSLDFLQKLRSRQVIIVSVIECLYTWHYSELFMCILSLQQTYETDTINITPIFHMRKLRPRKIFVFLICLKSHTYGMKLGFHTLNLTLE